MLIRNLLSLALTAGVLFLAACSTDSADSHEKRIEVAKLRDKIRGGWAGQMIGVSFGAPTEFRSLQKIMEGPLPEWNSERVKNSLNQDDLYVDMTFAQVLDDKGLDATTEDFGAMFRNAEYRLWHANLAARRALKRGVSALESGTPKYNAHANDIDFQIEADFVGLMAPGLPQASNDICYRAGRVINFGDGILGGMFISAMYSTAFFENNPTKIVEAGLAALPAQSQYAQVIADVLRWHKENPSDWKWAWQQIEDKWDRDEPCPAGALRPYNIDAKLNGAYVALGLLYGDGDMAKTLDISTRAGQDSDCNPASAAGVLGVVLGYDAIPTEWKNGIEEIANEKFAFTNYSLNSIVESTENRAIALVESKGGRRDGDVLIVKTEQPKPMDIPLWNDYGKPVERISIADPRWKFQGSWTNVLSDTKELRRKRSDKKSAEASIDFDGTGVILVGLYLSATEAGTAQVYVDGKLASTVDVSCDELDNRKYQQSVYHDFNLSPGKHTLKLVVLGKPYGDAKGAFIEVSDLVVFQK
ncbi:MAG: ADP-ribosylglycohydrolase family protein [Bryobacterales bacterium]|nr:ADP-ribosylglycohydrolase family protein [Bryobacterales bacterium]